MYEDETGEDLGWFFEDWVRSNKVLECRIVSQSSVPRENGFVSEVRVEYGLDSIPMLLPVQAVFEDGTSQVRWTDRFARLNTLRFESRTKLKEARIDPQGRLAVVSEPIARSGAELTEAIDNLDWTGTGEAALGIFKRPEAAGIKDPHAWFKMGLLLFDGRHYPESFEAFKKCGQLDRSKNNLFGALVWMGNIKDLLGDRDAAVSDFREALKHDPGWALQHDQYGLRIDKAWVEERLRTPFKWER
jgi:tetratricopeptide (TPR) repeat protein